MCFHCHPIEICIFITNKNLGGTNIRLVSYGLLKLKPEGDLILKYFVNNCIYISLNFIVVKVLSKPILGLKACHKLNLIITNGSS